MKVLAPLLAVTALTACSGEERRPAVVPTGTLDGVYRLVGGEFDGEHVDMARQIATGWKPTGQGRSTLEFARITMTFDGTAVTARIETVYTLDDTAHWCSVAAESHFVQHGNRISLPRLAAHAVGGSVASDDSASNNCDVSLDAMNAEVRRLGDGKLQLVAAKDGKPFRIDLVPDTADVDLKAHAKALIAR